MNESKLKYQIGLTLIKGVGAATARKLITALGDEEAVFNTKRHLLEHIPGIGKTLSSQIKAPGILDRAQREIEFMHKNNVTAHFYTEESYPFRLRECYDSPVILYTKGNAGFNRQKYLGIVGTRKMTAYGKANCEKIISALAQKYPDLVIVSGLAYGVDICAHKKSLDTNLQTIGVVSHGLDLLYPAAHKPFAEKMLTQGGLVTEYLSGTALDRNNFVARNRIIAGMCDVVLVVESGAKGGALLTAEFADSYNRDVCAIPGRINDTCSAGCNNLIKKNKATMIECAEDIELLMNWENASNKKQPVQTRLFEDLSPGEQAVINLLQKDEQMHIDLIARELQLPVNKISVLLFDLEFKNAVRCLPGGVYVLE
ncbi:MAG: DNA-processing protein DprA [Prevotellaceae bacterium]|jgi:DNA processing protein|nr:DNA-processing protein DprA [Prevotellaceae bacterium]